LYQPPDTRIVDVLDMVIEFETPGYLNSGVNVPEAVTATITTQWPPLVPQAVMVVVMPGLTFVLQSVVPLDSVPPLSHAHEFEDVIVSVPLEPTL
jgi:hypothetical protein